MGYSSGSNNQSSYSVAIGVSAGESQQYNNCIAIGHMAAQNLQRYNSIAIGDSTGYTSQGCNAIALGTYAGSNTQSDYTIAIGNYAGSFTQSAYAISIGMTAGSNQQGLNAVAIGTSAGYFSQRENAIAIGNQAGYSNQHSNTIVLNATGTALNSASPDSLFVAPIRTQTSNNTGALVYDTTSMEVTYNSSKTFVIDHPLDPANRYLVHACLEGPEAAVYYRGKGEIPVGHDRVRVQLPAYADAVAEDFTVNVTPIVVLSASSPAPPPRTLVATEVSGGLFDVLGSPGPFHWLVMGRRATLDVEPKKAAVAVRGDGPYRYIA
jgi:hypothetical protein